MQPETNLNDQQPGHYQEDYIPFDGFVNVNAIVEKRRQLRNATFNIASQSWNAAFDMQFDAGEETSAETSKKPSV